MANTFAATMAAGHAIGTVLAERYELRAHLGSGGMGAVYRAFDRELDEEVALKVLHLDLAASGDGLLRFRREVKLARRVTHPCVARTFDLGVHPGMRFLTMELIDGESLRARAALPVALPEALRIVSMVSRGLAAAHAQGVTHRDLKPENVMLAGDRVVVTDFGIARSDGDAAVTHGAIVGTPAYMAPEQVEARTVDGRADVFALGVVLFELCTRALPFEGDTPLAIAFARITKTSPDPRSVRADLPDGVAALIRAMLMRARESRPDAQTVADRLDELRGIGGDHGRPLRSGASLSTPIDTPSLGAASTIAIDPFTGEGETASTLAAGVSRAVEDAISSEQRVRAAPKGSADLVLSGDVRASGERARVRLRLSSRAGVTVFAGHLDGASSDPFALEDAVAARALEVVKKRVSARRGPSDESLRARWEESAALLASQDQKGRSAGLEVLEKLHHEAPNDPFLASMLAVALMGALMARGDVDEAACARAEELALRARDTDPSLPEAYHAVALVRAVFGDWRSALAAAREAIARSPSLADAQVDVGRMLCQCGVLSEGVARIELGLRLGPTGLFAARVLSMRMLVLTGHLDRGREALENLRRVAPPAGLGEIEMRTSIWLDERERCVSVSEIVRTRGGLWARAADVLLAHGSRRSVLEPIEALLTDLRSGRPSVRQVMQFGSMVTEIFTIDGLPERALDALEELSKHAWFVDLSWLDGAPTLAPLRTSPRYAALRAQMAIRAAEIVA